MIIAGVGARARATPQEIVAAVLDCCSRNGIEPGEVAMLAGLDRYETLAALRAAVDMLDAALSAARGHPGADIAGDGAPMGDGDRIVGDSFSSNVGVKFLAFSVAKLQLEASRCATHSQRSLVATGVPSVAEAAALAAAGPEGMLLAPRVAFATVTVALAIGPGATEP